ncbi:MAG: thioredoxin fold domain-containing protein [Nitrospirota bacterium]|jgi:thiol:disulfide interchange protein DsbC
MKKVIAERDDVVFYLKMLPLAQIHPQAYKMAKAIVCAGSNDKALAMLEDAYARKTLPDPTCQTDVVDQTVRLARSMGIDGTPAMVFEDGTLASGAVSAEELLKMIQKHDR